MLMKRNRNSKTRKETKWLTGTTVPRDVRNEGEKPVEDAKEEGTLEALADVALRASIMALVFAVPSSIQA
ncbi:hypothetical protein HZH68_011580 [Vespula germanica]|uniref:Uncharacterized protein n=1 Tax=Vespula germanica TaxID=30212 RepID=A0A834JRG2_VESGE|nr:hypothetical protein HZH68_011580 [Vespula germanica]